MPTNRLWQFNPGCVDQPCCGQSTPNPTPCCGGVGDCANVIRDPVILQNSLGSLTMGWQDNAGAWTGCQQFTHARTAVSLGSSGVGCVSVGTGTSLVMWKLTCTDIDTLKDFILSQETMQLDCDVPLNGTNWYFNSDVNCNNTGPSGPLKSNDPNFGRDSRLGLTGSLVSQNSSEIVYGFPTVPPSPNQNMIVPVSGNVTVSKPQFTLGRVPRNLYIDDGLGVVEMRYNGPRPVSLGTASDMWWGCATRHVTGGRTKAQSGDCAPTPVDFDTGIVFGLWCKGPSEGYRLYIFHDGCGSYDDGINVQTHQRESLGCSTPWIGQYNQIVGGSINGIAATSCNPFVFGPISQSFPATPYPYHPLREIYGDQGTWTITE